VEEERVGVGVRYVDYGGGVGVQGLDAGTQGDAEVEGIVCGEVGEEEGRLLAGEGFELGNG